MGMMINRRRVMMSTFNSYDLELYKSLIDGSLSGDIIVPNITSIKYGAFASCTGLTSVTIPNSVTSIGQYAFNKCAGLTSVTIGSGVTSIDKYTFKDCTGLTSITIPDSVTSIGQDAFSSCKGLTSITIPNSVTSIGDGAFGGCSGLTSVTIGSGVTSIGNSAFSSCSGLTSVTIPDSVTSIGSSAFQNCQQLSKVNSEIDGKCVINNTISVINVGLFRYNKFTEIIIPDSVITINDSAFCDSSTLTTVTIGNGIKNIYSGVFIRCPNLTSLTVLATTPPSIGTNSLYVTSGNLKIYVPAESVEAYKTKAGWSQHASKIQAIPTT